MSEVAKVVPIRIPQRGAFQIDWSSADRVLWKPEKVAAVTTAEEAFAEAKRLARNAQRILENAVASLRANRSRTIRVATVIVQLKEDQNGFHRKFDLPFEYTEETDLSGHVFTYDHDKYHEISRKERPNWQAELADWQACIKQGNIRVKEAEKALATALAAVETAGQQVLEAKGA